MPQRPKLVLYVNDFVSQHCSDWNPYGVKFGLQQPSGFGGRGALLTGGGEGGGGGGGGGVCGGSSHILFLGVSFASCGLYLFPFASAWHQRRLDIWGLGPSTSAVMIQSFL